MENWVRIFTAVFILISFQVAATEPITPLEPFVGLDPNKVALGKELFFEKNLSGDGTIACSSCHDLTTNGADVGALSFGVGFQESQRNTPTVFNAAYNFRQFWDGRARTLEEQVDGPITNPTEMGNNWADVLHFLNQNPAYRRSFRDTFGGPATQASVSEALAEFQRTLITTNGRFDQYLRGNLVLNENEHKGYELFKATGCVSCHQGRLVGGNIYEKVGVFKPYYTGEQADLGRFAISRNPENKFEFKVPSLRNVTQTPPYFHDGSVATLEQAIKIMSEYQSGIVLTTEEAKYIEAFLGTLGGTID